MSEEQAQMDYEAMNARTALDLNKALQKIERLEEFACALQVQASYLARTHAGNLEKIERLEAALRWALGESPQGMPEFPVVDGPPYYRWRTKLRELSGISPLREALRQGADMSNLIERLEDALQEIAASELSSGGQLRMLAREALDKDQI